MNEPIYSRPQVSSESTTIVGEKRHGRGPGPEIMDAATLDGNEVVNNQDESLGEIQSIMLDVPLGRIAYAVLAFGGFLGIGEKLFAVPWKALVLDTTRKCFILDIDKERLEQAPGFDKDNWPVMAELEWAQQIHTFYKSSPYWD